MAIENGEQVIPTEGFEGFTDEADDVAPISAIEDQDDSDELDDTGATIIEDTINEGLETEDDEETDAKAEGEETKAKAKAEGEETEVKAEGDEDDDFIPEVLDPDEEPEEGKKLSKKEKFERYSKSVQRRINKEVRQREQLREENLALQQRIANIEQNLQKNQVQSEAQVLENRLRNATAIKQQLLEEGEYAQAAEVDNDIIEMRIRKNQIDEYNASLQQGQVAPTQQPVIPAQQSVTPIQQAPVAPVTPAVPTEVPTVQTKWIENNPRFGREAGYTAFVNEQYDRMIEEGYNPEDPNMYRELDRRIGRTPVTKPSQQTTQTSTAAPAKPRTQAAPPPNAGRQATAGAKSSGLTEADKANMRAWGLNPNDVNQRKEWLRNRR